MRVLYGGDSGFLAELRSPQEKILCLCLAVVSGRHALTHNSNSAFSKSAFLANLIYETSTSKRVLVGPAHLLKYALKTAERMVKFARTDAVARKKGREENGSSQ